MAEKLEVDGFDVDAEDLHETLYSGDLHSMGIAGCKVAEAVIANLTPESKKRFEEYQDQNR